MPCPVTGAAVCHCPHRNPNLTAMGSAIMVDARAALRNVFNDHTWYTSALIVASVPVLQPDADAIRNRLLRNPKDIYDLLAPIVGVQSASVIRDLFTEHLVVANGLLEPVRNQAPPDAINAGVEQFYAQGNRLAQALCQLNPQKLHYPEVAGLISKHNQSVVQLALLRNELRFDEYVVTLDDYVKHMLHVADVLYGALL